MSQSAPPSNSEKKSTKLFFNFRPSPPHIDTYPPSHTHTHELFNYLAQINMKLNEITRQCFHRLEKLWKWENNKFVMKNHVDSHLIEYIEIVGVVIVGEVQNAVASVRSNPLQSSVAIRNATWFHLILPEFRRHLGCGERKETNEKWIKVYCVYWRRDDNT